MIYLLVMLIVCVPQMHCAAAKVSSESAKKEQCDIAASLNTYYSCALCGPMLPSNYRIDVSGLKHIIIPDNPQIWLNSKKCPQKCMFNRVVAVLRASTEKRFSLKLRAKPDGKKEYVLFDAEDPAGDRGKTESMGEKLGPGACVVITNAAKAYMCHSVVHAKHILMDLRQHAQNRQ